MEQFKASAKSNPNMVARAIAGTLREGNDVTISAIGAGALNQAVKAVAIARGYVAPQGIDVVCIPAFFNVEIEGEEKTGIKLIVQKK
jgi:stage V sporulation protein S